MSCTHLLIDVEILSHLSEQVVMGKSELILNHHIQVLMCKFLVFLASADTYFSKTTPICPGGIYELCKFDSLQVSIS